MTDFTSRARIKERRKKRRFIFFSHGFLFKNKKNLLRWLWQSRLAQLRVRASEFYDNSSPSILHLQVPCPPFSAIGFLQKYPTHRFAVHPLSTPRTIDFRRVAVPDLRRPRSCFEVCLKLEFSLSPQVLCVWSIESLLLLLFWVLFFRALWPLSVCLLKSLNVARVFHEISWSCFSTLERNVRGLLRT